MVFISIGVSIVTMMWIIGNAQLRFKSGAIKYDTLPTTMDRCEDYNFYGLIQNL